MISCFGLLGRRRRALSDVLPWVASAATPTAGRRDIGGYRRSAMYQESLESLRVNAVDYFTSTNNRDRGGVSLETGNLPRSCMTR